MIPGDYPKQQSFMDFGNDGVTIEPLLNATMSWTQFLYSTDVVLKITRLNNLTASASSSNVKIRPTSYNYTTSSSGDAVYVHVPFMGNGTRFSIEFEDDLWSYHTVATAPSCTESMDPSGPSGDCSYAQNVSSVWGNYFQQYNSSMPVVGTEPVNALLIFASPFPSDGLVAQQSDQQTLTAQPGFVSNLDKVSAKTIYFPPGVYWFGPTAHAVLGSSVNWVYLAPGAYVKGALEFTNSNASSVMVTGFGVLSGEQYVYQANPAQGYCSSKSDTDSLKMFRGVSTGQQNMTFTLNGITMANPPFNSMDFYNDTDSISTMAWDYKQVGAWFDQTDGLENYPGSHVHDVFYHSSDDTIKLYYSNATIENIVIWKKTNGPAIQLGWQPRNVSGTTVTNITQIHSRYFSNDAAGTTGDALIMSTVFPQDASNMNTADCHSYLSNVTISGLRAEGISPSLLRLSPLMNYDDMIIEDVWIDQLSPIDTGLQTSWARKWTDSGNNDTPVAIGSKSTDGVGLTVKDFYVGEEKVSFQADNWDAEALGSLDFDEFFWGHWTVQ